MKRKTPWGTKMEKHTSKGRVDAYVGAEIRIIVATLTGHRDSVMKIIRGLVIVDEEAVGLRRGLVERLHVAGHLRKGVTLADVSDALFRCDLIHKYQAFTRPGGPSIWGNV